MTTLELFSLPRMASRIHFLRLPATLRTFALTLLYTVTPALYITRNHASIYAIDGSSMSPLLSPDYSAAGSSDIVFFRKDIPLSDDLTRAEGGTGSKSKLERGMVVIFPRPDSKEMRWVVKRVVGVEGDLVTPLVRRRRFDAGGRSVGLEDGPLRRDVEQGRGSSRKVLKGQERQPKPPAAVEIPPEPVKIPYGHVWVEGVNAEDTVDSTEYGPISKSLIAGVGTRVIWPPSRWGDISWKADWEKSCRRRVKLARPEETGVPAEWAM